MDNKIYIVAGERIMKLAHVEGKGLYANVGQTSRQVSERLRDDDYKRKAAGGAWKVLFSQNVGDLSDKVIHPILKAHPRVRWENSDNTEEFLFLDDPGDGSEARKIVNQILSTRCVPLLKAENERLQKEIVSLQERLAIENEKLQKEIVSLQERLTIVDDVIGPTGVDVEKVVAAVQEREDLLARLGKSEAAVKNFRSVEAECSTLKNSMIDLESKVKNLRSVEAERSTLKNSVIDLESKVKNQKIFFAVLAAILFLVGRFWAGESHLEDLAKAQQERDIAYSALSTSDAQLKDLQAKMAKVETTQKSEPDLGKKPVTTPVRQKKQKEKRQEVKAQSEPTPAVQPVMPQEFKAPSAPAPTVQPTNPHENAGQTLRQFEACIYNEAVKFEKYVSVSDVMSCNVGNTLEMKKCLVGYSTAAGYVKLADAVSCWQRRDGWEY